MVPSITKKLSHSMSKDKTSAILAVYNSEHTVENVLKNICNSSIDNLEIIVVDDASTDNTRAICRKYPVKLIELSGNKGPAYCRNLAIRESTGSVLLFLDSDISFDPQILPAMQECLTMNPKLAGIFTLTAPVPLNPCFAARYFALQEYLRFMDVIAGGRETWSFISTRFGLLRKSVFEETGGFNESFALPAYEDLEFSSRMNNQHQLLLSPDFVVQHYWPDSIWKILKRLHINARGVMGFTHSMRQKASEPFIKDRNARFLICLSWIFAVAAILWWPLWIVAGGIHIFAMNESRWLLEGTAKYEGILFSAKTWLTYNATILPFITGVTVGIMENIYQKIRCIITRTPHIL